MPKYFISQPMGGRTDEEIQSERQVAIDRLNETDVPEEQRQPVTVLDSFFKDYSGNAIQFLGKSIQLLGEADAIVMLPGWKAARGCRFEHDIAKAYGLVTIYF